MFTGIIEAMGEVESASGAAAGRRVRIHAASLAPQLRAGESIAVNGVCVTVVEQDVAGFSFDAGPETLRRTNLGRLQPGDRVNLERSLRVGDRLSGHWVQGHVDGLGRVAERRRLDGTGNASDPDNKHESLLTPDGTGGFEYVRFECAAELTRLMVPRGSIAVDGVSLTVTEVAAEGFSAMLIPFTLAHTTLGLRQVGDAVNLETDILAKHAARLMEAAIGRPPELPLPGGRITTA